MFIDQEYSTLLPDPSQNLGLLGSDGNLSRAQAYVGLHADGEEFAPIRLQLIKGIGSNIDIIHQDGEDVVALELAEE